MKKITQNNQSHLNLVLLFVLGLFINVSSVMAQVLDEKCTVSLLNRTAQVNPDGTFGLNVPVEPGLFRARVVCDDNGAIIKGQTPFFTLDGVGSVDLSAIKLGSVSEIPVSINVFAPQTVFTLPNESAAFQAIGTLPDNTSTNLTTLARGTLWTSSNNLIASVSVEGVVTAHKRGRAIIQARNEGVLGSISIDVLIVEDSDSDGLPDAYERANGLNPNDPTDAVSDQDGDGLTALQEFELGTSPLSADSDGDGLTDGDESINQNTDPLQADSDGDGLLDGDEVRLASNPNNPDTDGDGITDGVEFNIGLDILTNNATTTVTGQIIDSNGAAVAGASAIVLDQFVTTAANDGRFILPNVPADQGDLVVFVRSVSGNQVADGASQATAPVFGGQTDVGSVTMQPVNGRVTGVVLDPRGGFVVGASVTVNSATGSRNVISGANGFYQVDNFSAGDVTVLATDVNTGLRGRSTGQLPVDSSTTIDVNLTAAGALTGAVVARDNSSGVPGSTVSLRGPRSDTLISDPLSEYRFDFLPLGVYTIDAADAEGNRGRTSATLTGSNQLISRNITYLGRGSVDVVVESATGTAVSGATVTISSRSLFGGRAMGISDSSGTFSFADVFIGDFDLSARDPVTGLGGFASGKILREGNQVTIVVSLQPAGTITGTIFENGGLVPVAGAFVTLSPSGRQAVTDSTGSFTVESLPLGVYTLNVNDPANGDQQRAVVNLQVADGIVNQQISLNGLGTLDILVVDAGGQIVPDAQIILNCQGAFGCSRQGMAASDGSLTLSNILAGPFTIRAMDPVDQLGGTLASNLIPGETAGLTVELEAAGNITGTILAADNVTPVAGVRVSLSPIGQEVISGTDGSFRFDMVPIARSPFSIRANDSNGALRAEVTGNTLTTHGEEVSQDLIMSGTGTVSGTVLSPDGSVAATVGVTIVSSVSGMPVRFGTTDSTGFYEIGGIPEGSVTVSAGVPALRLAGSASGKVSNDGEVVDISIQMLENQLVVPTSSGGSGNTSTGTGTLLRLFDANNFEFNIRQDGQIRDGNTNVFRGDGGINRGAEVLTIIDNGTEEAFIGTGGGVFEDNGRELVITGTSGSSIQATRKVFVPEGGYFSRYLEILNNPTTTAVTVDVQLNSYYRSITQNRDGFRFTDPAKVVSTSSGDQFLDASDNWLVVDDNTDEDPFINVNLPSVVEVFNGTSGSVSGMALFDTDFDANFSSLNTRWDNITVQPGQTVILMHFMAQQTSRVGAQASADRLGQLPAEALIGLSAAERAQIINFSVPINGVSLLSDLPTVDGVVTGVVLENDGITPINRSRVSIKSNLPFYGRTYTTTSNSLGEYNFSGRLLNGSNIAIPRGAFNLGAVHPVTGMQAPAVNGGFQGLQNNEQDVVFTNTGTVTGTVRRADGTVVSQGFVDVSGGGILNLIRIPIAVDGLFVIHGLAPEIYTLTATLPNTEGSNLTGVTSANIMASEVTTADISFADTASVSGILFNGSGDPVINGVVGLISGDFSRSVRTDTGGNYIFNDIPLGSYTLNATELNTGVESSVSVDVLAGQNTSANLSLINLGSVVIQASFPSGRPVESGFVQIQNSAVGDFFNSVGRTDANGLFQINNVPAGNFSIRVLNPINTNLGGIANGAIFNSDQVVNLNVTVTNDQIPSITIVSPIAGVSFLNGSTITLQASANDDIAVGRVDFLVDGLVVGSDFSAPYLIATPITVPAGVNQSTVSAIVFDSAGQSASSTPIIINLANDLTAPNGNLFSPTNGQSFIEGGSLVAQANFTDNVAMDRVVFSANGQDIIDNRAPYSAQFSIPENFADSGPVSMQINAVGFDRSGNSTSHTVVVNILPDQIPTINLIQAPAEGANLIEGSSVVIEASPSDDVRVSKVDLLLNGDILQTRTSSPYHFTFNLPAASSVTGPVSLVMRVTDSQGQTNQTAARNVNVIVDRPPVVSITLPLVNTSFIEGRLVDIATSVSDDIGIQHVQFLVNGQFVSVDTLAPFSGNFRMPGGINGSSVEITAIATDTLGQTSRSTVNVIRQDDVNAPSGRVVSLGNGSIISVGSSDVSIIIDTSGSTSGSCGTDIDNDGLNDNILKCEISAAKELLNFLDPNNTKVSIVDFSSSAILVQTLTQDFNLAEQALNNILAAGPGGGTNFIAAMNVATNELVSIRSRKSATSVQLFFSDGSSNLPTQEITRANEGGIVVNTFAVGSGANTTTLQEIATGTGGVLTPVTDPGALVDILPNLILFGIDSLPVIVEATDDIAVAQVAIHIFSADGQVDQTIVDGNTPFATLFSLPTLIDSLDLTIEVTVMDFGGNSVDLTPVNVTVLPAENNPEIVRLEPALGVPGQSVDIIGKFFDPVASNNIISFNGVNALISSGSKIKLTAIVPAGVVSGLVSVNVAGIPSNSVAFSIDNDGDGLSDEDEASLGTDPNNSDSDADGLLDGVEVNTFGTDPLSADTDGDGINDNDEIVNGLDPLLNADATADFDSDGLINVEEITLGTNINNSDSDNDGLIDGDEVNVHGTDPLVGDTDGGGRLDGSEVSLDGTDPLNPLDDVNFVTLPLNLFDSNNFRWDIQRNGNISDGTSDAYDGGLKLVVNGSNFQSFNEASPEELDREVAIGPQAIGALTVSRKVFVPSNDTFARFLEIVENPTNVVVNAEVVINTNLGSDSGTLLISTSTGDQLFTPEDDYLVTDDGSNGGGDPSMVHVFSGAGALIEPSGVFTNAPGNDDFSYTFNVTVPANGRTIIMHFASQNSNLIAAQATALRLHDLQGSALDGLSVSEQRDIVNFVAFQDSDGDGLNDFQENSLGTDPQNADTDGDGLSDGFEVNNGFNPLLTGDEALDSDTDGLTNLVEQNAGTDPHNQDTDNDGLIDGDEVNIYASNPLQSDSDGDGLKDGDEVNIYGTDPNNMDTDGDSLSDNVEVQAGLNPLDANDATADSDGDGLSNAQEIVAGSDPNNFDTDGDGINDGDEVNVHGTNPIKVDTDNDGLDDNSEITIYLTSPVNPDSDAGGRYDGNEILLDGTDPLNSTDDSELLNSGDLLVQDHGSDNILRISANGAVRIEVARSEVLTVIGRTDLSYFDQGLAVDKKGTIYFTESLSDSLLKRELSGTVSILTTAAQMQAVTGVFPSPRKITIGKDGKIYVNDNNSQTVFKIDPDTGNPEVFVSNSQFLTLSGINNVNLFSGIATGIDGTIYTTSDGNNPDAIFAISTAGVPSIVVSSRSLLSDLRDSYMSIAPDGTIVITDQSADQIFNISVDGLSISNRLTTAEIQAAGAGQSPDLEGGIAFDQDGNLYITEENGDNILRFGLGSRLGQIFTTQAAMSFATGVRPDLDGDLVVVPSIDSDLDGISDLAEIKLGTNPDNVDTDNDGLNDGFEVTNGFDPLDPLDARVDTDNDGIPDGLEILNGLNPNDPSDASLDPDNDDLTNSEETVLGTNVFKLDTDSDGLTDGDEVNVYNTDPLDFDTDNGGRSDGQEIEQDLTNPLDGLDDRVPVELPLNLTDANGFLWDIRRDGNINNGTSDAYDGGLRLTINGLGFGSFNTGRLENGRELNIGPFNIVGSLRIQRKIFIPENDSFARFLEIIKNPTVAPIDATIQLNTNLGSDSSTQIITTSSGDFVANADDDYLITDDVDNGGDPTMVHVFSDSRGQIRPEIVTAQNSNDNIFVSYNVEVPAGGRVIIMHFASQNSDQANAQTSADRLRSLAGSALDGLTIDEQNDIINFFAFRDSDNDGLSDDDEILIGTDINNPDTDGDGLLDGFEVGNGFDPLDPADVLIDSDTDGISDALEILNGLNPSDSTDALANFDFDLLNNADEIQTGTDPFNSDTDGDGLDDYEEVIILQTDPLNIDTDAGGRTDGQEVNLDQTNPLDPIDDITPQLISSGLASADHVKSVIDSTGNIHYVWDDVRNGSSSIFYKMIDQDGRTVLIDDTDLTPSSTSNEKRPDIAIDSQQHVHIVWQDQRLGGVEVFHKVVFPAFDDQNGSSADVLNITLVQDHLISLTNNEGGNARSKRPRLRVDSLDNVHVVWEETDFTGQVYYAKLGAAGETLISPRVIFTGGTFQFQIRPAITVDFENNPHIILAEQKNTLTKEIFYLKLNGTTGLPLIDATLVTADDGLSNDFPSIGLAPDNTIAIVYQATPNPDNQGVAMLHFDPATDDQNGGAADITLMQIGIERFITDPLLFESSRQPTAIVDQLGNIRVVYYKDSLGLGDGDVGAGSAIVYKMIAIDGSVITEERQLTNNFTATTSTDSSVPSIVALDNDRTMVAWTDAESGLPQILAVNVPIPDSDFDSLNNRVELELGTDPNNQDTDGDGVFDGVEVFNGTDPLNPSDF